MLPGEYNDGNETRRAYGRLTSMRNMAGALFYMGYFYADVK